MIKIIYKKERYIFTIGLLVVLTAMLPYLILGENMIVFYPDQLDGEVLSYIYMQNIFLLELILIQR